MHIPILILLGASAAFASTSGYIKADVEVGFGQRLVKRQTSSGLSSQLTWANNDTLYFVNVSIGTPPQPFRLQLDTGSADLVIVKTGTISCNGVGECPSGTFDPAHSSTYGLISQDTFNISYVDGDGYNGDWISDVVDVGGTTLNAGTVYIGLADKLDSGPNHPNTGVGLLGVSYQAESAGNALTSHNNTLPPTSLSAMVFSGAINRQAFSVALGSAEAGEGSVVFGGVDPSLYTGDLVAVQILQDPNEFSKYTSFRVPLTGISVTDGTGTRMLTPSSFAVPALIDSGTTNTKLPSSVLASLVAGFGATMTGDDPIIPCSRNSSTASISYHFGGDGGPAIEVPLSSLITPVGSDMDGIFADGVAACHLGIGPLPNDDHVILGDSFMRSGYFVFDLENNQIAMAAAATSPSAGGAVTAIPSGTEIPGCSSTNSFTDAPTANVNDENVSQIPTQTLGKDGNLVAATPTFDLGAAASSGGTSTSTSTSTSSPSNTAPSVKALPLAWLVLIGAFFVTR